MTEQHDIPLVYDNILTPGPEVHLQGGYCPSCDLYHFPQQDRCTECLGTVNTTDLGNKAVIHSVTTIRTRAPLGLPSPYSVAYLDLKHVPLRVFSLMDPAEAGQYSIGQEVELQVAPLGLNNNKEICLRPYFRTCANSAE
ncbi:MAG: hypothetical protein JKY45_07815 [Emcibacter sp.]|nr:hypothetical protein [Emcibacter sp.]